MRYAVDHTVVLHVLHEGIELSTDHMVLAPTLVRSQVLEALYGAVGRGELPREIGLERLGRFAAMKIRYLGDKVLRRRAWSLAEQLGWDSTHPAEAVALAQLQADAFVTLDAVLAAELDGVVETAPIEVLLQRG